MSAPMAEWSARASGAQGPGFSPRRDSNAVPTGIEPETLRAVGSPRTPLGPTFSEGLTFSAVVSKTNEVGNCLSLRKLLKEPFLSMELFQNRVSPGCFDES